jgi:hypothetical protein
MQLPRRDTSSRLGAASPKTVKKPTIRRFGDDTKSSNTPTTSSTNTNKELVKKMLMSRVKGKVDQVEKKKSLTRYNFPSDKPTYSP